MIDMSSLGSRYMTRVTLTPALAVGWTSLLTENPLRYFVRFEVMVIAGGVTFVAPSAVANFGVVPTAGNTNLESKWADDVTRTTGAWSVYSAINNRVLITEVIQLP